MTIDSQEKLEGMQRAGRAVAQVHREVRRFVRPGITTGELDEVAGRALARLGARSAPRLEYDFPGETCISVNEEAVHGVPGRRVVEDGDLVTIDIVAELDGYFADAAVTIPLGPVSQIAARLCACAEAAFWKAASVARASARLAAIGREVEAEVERQGFQVVRELCGHGIGHSLHEAPTVPNHYEPRLMTRLRKGLVIAIEPIISAGSPRTELADDRWTVRSADGSLTAHYEHTILVTDGRPLVLTAGPV